MAEEEEDSHLFNIFEFAEQIGNWSQTIINSIVVLNARDVPITTSSQEIY